MSSGTTYYLQVDAVDADAPHGSFALRVNLPGAASGVPANNNLASASRVIPGINASVDNRNATTEGTEPQQAGRVSRPINNTVWLQYTSTIARALSFFSVGATASVVNVYSGPANATAAQLVAVDCHSSNTGDSYVGVTATAGTRYYVQVGSPAAGGSAVPFTFLAQQSDLGTALEGVRHRHAGSHDADPDGHGQPRPVRQQHGAGHLQRHRRVPGEQRRLARLRPLDRWTAKLNCHVRPSATTPTPRCSSARRRTSGTRSDLHRLGAEAGVDDEGEGAQEGDSHLAQGQEGQGQGNRRHGGASATGTVTFEIGRKKVTRTLKNGVATVKVRIKKKTKVVATYNGDANTAGSSGKAKIKIKKP